MKILIVFSEISVSLHILAVRHKNEIKNKEWFIIGSNKQDTIPITYCMKWMKINFDFQTQAAQKERYFKIIHYTKGIQNVYWKMKMFAFAVFI